MFFYAASMAQYRLTAREIPRLITIIVSKDLKNIIVC